MSIILYTGIPGSGKSYCAVYEMMFGGIQEKYFILHNIKGLKPQYFNEHVKDWREIAPETVSEFFTVKYFEPIVKDAKEKYGKAILLIVDEAWEYFEKLTDENLEFFSWHRHIGMDIWLITQDASDLQRGLRKRAEYEITGNKSTIVDHFVYTYKANRTRFRVRKLPKKEEVFRAYQSFDVDGAEKKKSQIVKLAGVALVLSAGLLVYGIGWAIPGMFGGGKSSEPRKVLPQPGASKAQEAKPEPVAKKEAVPASGVRWEKYTLAAVIGRNAYVQDESGRLIPLRTLLPKARVLEYADGCASINTGVGSIEQVCKQVGLVKVKAHPVEDQAASAGGRGGSAQPPPPADAAKLMK